MKKPIFIALVLLFSLTIFSNCKSDDNGNDTSSEICNNGTDDDGDGFTDCEDFDCVCEICDNEIDDDGDGFTDGEDSDCSN